MPIEENDIKEIKEKIISQIESWNASEEQKEQAIEQVASMNALELEEFLKKNQSEKGEKPVNECPFCLIVQGKLPAYKIDENKSNLAVLEINPLSHGHTIILSKNHNKLSSSAFILANKVAKKLKSKLKPEDVKIENISIMGHKIVAVIPTYKDKKLEKKKLEEKELILLQDKLKQKPKVKKVKPISITEKQLPEAPRRIP